jgi:hypothetical protein
VAWLFFIEMNQKAQYKNSFFLIKREPGAKKFCYYFILKKLTVFTGTHQQILEE